MPIPLRLAAAVLCVLASCAGAAAQAPTASSILERSIDAMGGFENFARLREVRIESTSVTAGSPSEIGIVRVAKFPHTMTIDYERGKETERYRYEGMQVTAARLPGSLEPAGEELRDRVRQSYWREWWVVYARFAWHGLGEVWLEAGDDDGRGYYTIRVRPRDAGEYRLLVDAETLRPVRRIYSVAGGDIVEAFSDFETLDGILFPTTVELYLDGELMQTVRHTSIAVEFDSDALTLERRFDAILEASLAEKGIPGMVAMIERGDETLWHRAYGMDSVELGLATSDDSVFPLASVSKIFAGAVAMRLVEQGLLDLDAPITNYIDSAPDRYAAVTPRHLLSHSHGLVDALSDNPGRGLPMASAEEGTRRSRLEFAFSRPLKFEPGTGWAYSIVGFEVLQAIFEAVTGLDYEALARREIFEPLGMTSARFGGSDRIIPGRNAMDYVWVDGKLEYNYLNYPAAIYTAAGLNASARDVMRFYRAVTTGELLSLPSRDEMWREIILDGGEPSYYGLGWGSFRTTRDDRWSVGHSGGGSSWTRYFPALDLTVVVLSNLNGAREDKLVYDLATAVEQDTILNPR